MILAKAFHVFMQGGVMMWLLVLITLVVYGIVLRLLWHLFVRGGNDSLVIQNCLDGLLFWGWFAVVIGILGSAIGMDKDVSKRLLRDAGIPVARHLCCKGKDSRAELQQRVAQELGENTSRARRVDAAQPVLQLIRGERERAFGGRFPVL